uniref:UBN2 domain-containing protein n=1 Tax=Tanacetum cinerariifolium TaxID=118510 RepID=A0A699HVJ6_TANCI|nr:hypothetical protein [Tanacetum cinerariifolium]
MVSHQNGDFYFEVEDEETKLIKETPYKLLEDDQKKKLAKVTTINEAKDLATLPLDELIENLKVYEMVLDNDGIRSKTTKEKVKSLSLKAKVTREQTSDDSDSQDGSDKEEEAGAINVLAKNILVGTKGGESSMKKGSSYNCAIEGHFASERKKPKENKAFIGGA